ncbi:MAG: hypothetical protein M3Y19_03770 [Actinomycetota bacterium]|nr:hypothetical protein [Actinomycetota bacterium]
MVRPADLGVQSARWPLPARALHRTAAELRWAFTPPWTWLLGVGINLVLSLLWLAWQPVDHTAHRDWVVLVGTYFASFILADVTTTNILGADPVRVRANLAQAIPIREQLLAKNGALLVIVGLPTLLLTAALTATLETPQRLAITLPDVALPIFAWLGVGNLVSVLLPVAVVPLHRRWQHRRDRRATMRWLWHLLLPYALWYAVDPVDQAPRALLGPQLNHSLGPDVRSLLHALVGLLIWLIGTWLAGVVVRHRGLRLR